MLSSDAIKGWQARRAGASITIEPMVVLRE